MKTERIIANNKDAAMLAIGFLLDAGVEFVVKQTAPNRWEIVAKTERPLPDSIFNL